MMPACDLARFHNPGGFRNHLRVFSSGTGLVHNRAAGAIPNLDVHFTYRTRMDLESI